MIEELEDLQVYVVDEIQGEFKDKPLVESEAISMSCVDITNLVSDYMLHCSAHGLPFEEKKECEEVLSGSLRAILYLAYVLDIHVPSQSEIEELTHGWNEEVLVDGVLCCAAIIARVNRVLVCYFVDDDKTQISGWVEEAISLIMNLIKREGLSFSDM